MTRTEPPAARDWVIQLLVDNDRNESLLRDWLDNKWVIVTEPVEGVDVVIVDRNSLDEHAGEIETRKREQRPQHLPVLALVPAQRGSQSRALEPYRDFLDDIVEIPVERWELNKSIESQLQSRLFSLELRNREKQYRELVELLPEGIVIVQDRQIVYLNEVGRNLFSGSDDDWSATEGEPLELFVAPEDHGRMDALLDELEAEGLYKDVVEVDIESQTGERYSCEVSGVRVTYRDMPAIQLIVRDVTDRKRQQRQIELFRRALDDTDQGVTIADANQDNMPIVYANAAFERITGYPTAETIGRNCRFLQGPDTDPETIRQMRAAIEEQRPISVEVENYRRDGTAFWNEVTITPVMDDDDEVTHFIGFQKDITERIEREQRLKEYEAVLQAAGDPIFAVGADRRLSNVNEAFVSFTGRNRPSLIGKAVDSVFTESDQLVSSLQSVDETNESTRVSAVLVNESGERRRCEVSLAPGDSGDVVGVIRDMTEERLRQQRIAVFDRLLRHNLRNKMNVILGRAESIAIHEQGVREQAEAILAAGEDLLALVDGVRSIHDLLDEPVVKSQVYPFESLVRRRIEGVSKAYPDVDVEVDLTPVEISGHPELGMGLDQLLENAFKHNTKEPKRVRVSLSTVDDRAMLEISDNGPGIPEDELVVLSEDIETPMEHSQGVGMWLARWTIQRSGGEIAVDVDDGTTVTVFLPIAGQ